MASLATHFSAFVLLFPIGLRRLLCSSSLYLKNPSLYRSKIWYFSEPKWKNFDLYTLTIALPIASFSEIFIFLAFSGHPTYRFAFFQQSAAIFMFWALVILIICRENIDTLHIDEGFVFVIAAISFLVEYSVIGKGISGLGGAMYDILGCKKMSVWPNQENAEWKCDLEEDGLRGVSLMTLLFIGHAIAVLLLSLMLFALVASNWNLRCGDASGPLLAQLDSGHVLMPSSLDLDME
ncbi:hypothetical protein CerSpe_004710 [Prunus speciosa]